MKREGYCIARCTVERLMKRLVLQGARRGKVVRTTISDMKAPCPQDRVSSQFKADRPNQLRVSDFTYVSTWQGWLYVVFVIDVYARRIVGWRVSSPMHTDFVLNAQALYDRQPQRDGAFDLPPASRTSLKLVKSVNHQENDGHEEEQIHRGTDHRLPQAGRGRHADQGAVPQWRFQ